MPPESADAQITRRWIAIRDEMDRRGLKRFDTLSEQELTALENRAGVRLPEEYRQYLLIVGDGGDGPPFCGGITMLAHIVTGQLALPFPLTDYWIWEDDPEPQPECRKAVDNGKIVLGHDGCGMYWILIVTGPERGQVWQETGEGVQPCCPRRDFLSWFEYWLAGGDDWWADFKFKK